MWRREVSAVYSNVAIDDVWNAWVDVSNWHQWDTAIEYCDIRQQFAVGNKFILKPQHGPKVKVKIKTVEPNKVFISYCNFLGARMYHEHYLEQVDHGVKITQVVRLTGPLTFLWKSIVAEKLVNQIPQQTKNLVDYLSSAYV